MNQEQDPSRPVVDDSVRDFLQHPPSYKRATWLLWLCLAAFIFGIVLLAIGLSLDNTDDTPALFVFGVVLIFGGLVGFLFSTMLRFTHKQR
ncbi:MAG: hypothetical protein P8J86_04210 [Phycisphaerales bacterium]|nr:hypothetical protein [Phycisphaerales bacterium]